MAIQALVTSALLYFDFGAISAKQQLIAAILFIAIGLYKLQKGSD